jgi:hypothetical protein
VANKIGIGVTVDDGGAVKKINGISKAFDKLGGKGSGASLFGNVAAKGVALGFNLIGDAISGVTDFLADSVKKFNEDAQAQALLEQALQNNIAGWKFSQKAVNDYIDAQIELGFVDDDVRASLSQLVGITHDATKAQELNTLAEDLARAKGIDLAVATDIVTKAHEGNYKALKSLGIQIPKNSTAVEALDLIQKNVKGSADAWANTTSGKLQIAQDKFSEAQEKLGGVIMPILSSIMIKFTDDWLPALGRGWDKVRPIILGVAGAIGAVIAVIQKALGWIGDIISALSGLIKKIGDALGALGKLAGQGQDQFYHPKAPGGTNMPTTIVGTGGARMPGGSALTIQGVSAKDMDRIINERMFVLIRRAAPGTA